ncbi:MAG: YgjP-like metallopeptidase domain-containing protein [Conexivisphaera sp.]
MAQIDGGAAREGAIEYGVRYRRIKYPRLEFKTGHLILVLPIDYADEASLLKRHERWIMSRAETINEALERSRNLKLVERTGEEFHLLVEGILHMYEDALGKKANRVYYRRMNSKWASYSARGNLTINTMMRYLPEELVSYVILHELTHASERRHNANFWRSVERVFRNHDELEGQLLSYWFLVNSKSQKDRGWPSRPRTSSCRPASCSELARP